MNKDFKKALDMLDEGEPLLCGNYMFKAFMSKYHPAIEYFEGENYFFLNSSNLMCANNINNLSFDQRFNLAVCYLLGIGVEPSVYLAKAELQKLVDINIAKAQYLLAWLYLKGRVAVDITQDKRNFKAFALFEKAADNGFVAAYNQLGWMFENNRSGFEINEIEKFRQAFKLYLQAAKYQDSGAQYNLGRMLLTGLAGSKLSPNERDSEAFKWISQSANQKYPPALGLLGNMYLRKKVRNNMCQSEILEAALKYYIMAYVQEEKHMAWNIYYVHKKLLNKTEAIKWLSHQGLLCAKDQKHIVDLCRNKIIQEILDPIQQKYALARIDYRRNGEWAAQKVFALLYHFRMPSSYKPFFIFDMQYFFDEEIYRKSLYDACSRWCQLLLSSDTLPHGEFELLAEMLIKTSVFSLNHMYINGIQLSSINLPISIKLLCSNVIKFGVMLNSENKFVSQLRIIVFEVISAAVCVKNINEKNKLLNYVICLTRNNQLKLEAEINKLIINTAISILSNGEFSSGVDLQTLESKELDVILAIIATLTSADDYSISNSAFKQGGELGLQALTLYGIKYHKHNKITSEDDYKEQGDLYEFAMPQNARSNQLTLLAKKNKSTIENSKSLSTFAFFNNTANNKNPHKNEVGVKPKFGS